MLDIKKILESPAVAPLTEPLEITRDIARSGINRFFHDVTSFAFLKRLGTLACVLAGAGAVALLVPSLALDVFVLGLVQIPIAIFQEPIMAACKKKWLQIKESPMDVIKHPATLLAAAALVVTGAALAPLLIPRALAIGLSAIIGLAKPLGQMFMKKTNEKVITAYKNHPSYDGPSTASKEIIETFEGMKTQERAKIFDELEKRFPEQFKAAAADNRAALRATPKAVPAQSARLDTNSR